jgi:hypothetical protein
MRARQGKGRRGGCPGPASEKQFQRSDFSTVDIRRETPRALPKGLDLPIYFVNEQWAVTSYGIECLDDYYVIEADRLDERRLGTDLPDWPVHLAEKNWVDLSAFIEAFRFAIRKHRHRYETTVTDDQIAAACAAAMRERADEEWFARRLQRRTEARDSR